MLAQNAETISDIPEHSSPGSDGHDFKARILKHGLQAKACKVEIMRRTRQAPSLRSGKEQLPARFQDPKDFVDAFLRISQVVKRLSADDRVIAGVLPRDAVHRTDKSWMGVFLAVGRVDVA
jgi:hypothetical protein